jgi:undecaprenyl pyrophosphate synthase
MAQGHRDPHTARCTRTPGGDLLPNQPMLVRWCEGGFGLLYDRLLTKRVQHGPVPTHVAIIMDGNRRFALAGGMPQQEGHHLGKEKVREVMRWCRSLGITYLTVYALSTENLTSRSLEGLNLAKATIAAR